MNGTEVGGLLRPEPLQWNSRTEGGTQRPRGDEAVLNTPIELDLTPFKEQLRRGGNVIAIHGLNNAPGSFDFLVRTRLEINHNVTATPLPVPESQVMTARTFDGSTWSAPARIALQMSDDLIDQGNLVISEIMYHPVPPSPDEITAGFNEDNLFEYLELLNIGARPVTLAGLSFTNGILFDFNEGSRTFLASGERVLLVRNQLAFEHRYGTSLSSKIIGEFSDDTRLNNDGERLTLGSPDGSAIRDFSYSDRAPWPTAPDGNGFSLILDEPASNPDHANPTNWHSSATPGGTPGGTDTDVFQDWAGRFGNPTPDSDDDFDQRDALLEFAQGSSPAAAESPGETTMVSNETDGSVTVSFQRNLRADGITIELESSTDLETWHPADANWIMIGEENLGDGRATVHYRSWQVNVSLFLRQRVTLR